MKISLAIRGTMTDPLPLFSVRMGRRFFDIKPNTWTSEPSRNKPSWGEAPNTSNYNNNNDAAPNDCVDQSRLSNAPRTQATTRTNQSDSYFDNDDHEDYGDLPDAWSNYEDYAYATQSWSTPLPSYDTVPQPESLWQPYHMQQYNPDVETIEQLRHLGTLGMKPPYRFEMHKDDPLATKYIKLEPSVLTIASSALAGQRGCHVFLGARHAAVVANTNTAITKLSKTINIDSLGRTAPFPYDMMRSTPDTSFDEHANAGGKPSYQWYTKIEVACQNFRKTLVDWRHCNEELNWGFRNNLSEHDLCNQAARLSRMHREISGIDNLMHVADGIELIFRYRRLWTVDRMKGVEPVAVSFLGLIRGLQKVCQTNNWLFEDRAPFLAYKVDFLFRRHQLPASTLSSWRPFTRLDLDTSDTRTSISKSDELLAFSQPVRSMSTSFLSWTPLIRFDAWVPRNTSCPPSKADTRMDDVGVERSNSEGMSAPMKGRSSDQATRLRVTRSTRTLSTTGLCRRIRTSIGTTSTSRPSSTSRRSMLTSKLPINARSAAQTRSSKRSLWTRF